MCKPKIVQLTNRPAYGRNLLYPYNANAQYFCNLVGMKTITPRNHFATIFRLGFDIMIDGNYVDPNDYGVTS